MEGRLHEQALDQDAEEEHAAEECDDSDAGRYGSGSSRSSSGRCCSRRGVGTNKDECQQG